MPQTGDKKTPTMLDLLKYWYTDLSIEQMAEKLGVNVGKIYALRRKYQLPKRSKINKTGRKEKDPTPEEIAAATAGLRVHWSARDEVSRRVGWKPAAPWVPPVFSVNSRTGIFVSTEHLT